MSSWTDVKNLIFQLLPDTGINVITPKKQRDAFNAVIDQIVASTPDPVEFEWKAVDENGDSVTYAIGAPVLDDNRWFIALVENTNKKPILPGGAINTDFWVEENANTSRYIDFWEAQLYTYGVEIVLHSNGLYLLDRDVVGAGPFQSTNIATEISADPPKWINLTPASEGNAGIDPSKIVNDFSTDPSDVSKVAGANAVYLLFQLLNSDDTNYDTLQEIVTFIKTIDTDGELVAAIDAAVGNTLWRIGGSETITFSAVVDLDKDQQVKYTIAGAIAYTLGSDVHLLNKRRVDILIADGINKPTFSGDFTVVYDGYNNSAGIKNIITFQYLDDDEVAVYIQYAS